MQLLRQANDAFAQGRFPLAAQLLRRVLRQLPRNAQAHDQLARVCMRQRDFASAITHLRVLSGLQPRNVSVWVRLIHCLNVLGNHAGAVQALESASAVGMDERMIERLEAQLVHPPLVRQQMLLSQYQQGDDTVTCEIAAHLFISDYPEHPLGWQILGALQHDAGRLEEALQTKRKTVQRFAHDVNAWHNLACTQLALGQAQAARQSADKALSLDPTHANAAACRQRALTQIGGGA